MENLLKFEYIKIYLDGKFTKFEKLKFTVYIHTYTHLYTHIYIYIYIHTYTHLYIYIYTHIHIHRYTVKCICNCNG